MSTQQENNSQAANERSYQHQYEPPSYTDEEKDHLHRRTDANLCNREVGRVARNIASAIAYPQTPKIVRKYIRKYLDGLFGFDLTETPEAILCLYPIACRRISQRPFVPDKETIEALTGNDKEQAIAATKEETDDSPRKVMSVKRVVRLTDALFKLDRDDEADIAITLIALIDGIGWEIDPRLRKRLVDEVCHRAYCHAIRCSEEEKAFIDKAIETKGKVSPGQS